VSQDFDVVCLGGGVAGEAMAGGLRGSGLTLAIPLASLADVIHPFPAFNRVLGASVEDLAAQVAR